MFTRIDSFDFGIFKWRNQRDSFMHGHSKEHFILKGMIHRVIGKRLLCKLGGDIVD